MLVRFHSKAGSVTMFEDVAKTLLRLMGKSGDVPGAVLAKDVPEALRRLQDGVTAHQAAPAPRSQAAEEDRDGEKVSLPTRAFPLIQLLAAAAKRDCDVIWEDAARSTG